MRTWLYAIARGVALNLRRQSRRREQRETRAGDIEPPPLRGRTSWSSGPRPGGSWSSSWPRSIPTSATCSCWSRSNRCPCPRSPGCWICLSTPPTRGCGRRASPSSGPWWLAAHPTPGLAREETIRHDATAHTRGSRLVAAGRAALEPHADQLAQVRRQLLAATSPAPSASASGGSATAPASRRWRHRAQGGAGGGAGRGPWSAAARWRGGPRTGRPVPCADTAAAHRTTAPIALGRAPNRRSAGDVGARTVSAANAASAAGGPSLCPRPCPRRRRSPPPRAHVRARSFARVARSAVAVVVAGSGARRVIPAGARRAAGSAPGRGPGRARSHRPPGRAPARTRGRLCPHPGALRPGPHRPGARPGRRGSRRAGPIPRSPPARPVSVEATPSTPDLSRSRSRPPGRGPPGRRALVRLRLAGAGRSGLCAHGRHPDPADAQARRPVRRNRQLGVDVRRAVLEAGRSVPRLHRHAPRVGWARCRQFTSGWCQPTSAPGCIQSAAVPLGGALPPAMAACCCRRRPATAAPPPTATSSSTRAAPRTAATTPGPAGRDLRLHRSPSTRGCGFEQPFEAMRTALTTDDHTNAGFLPRRHAPGGPGHRRGRLLGRR